MEHKLQIFPWLLNKSVWFKISNIVEMREREIQTDRKEERQTERKTETEGDRVTS